MGNLKEIVGIKNDQDFQTLVDTGTLTYGDQTIEYSDDAIYFTPDTEEGEEIDAYTKQETEDLIDDKIADLVNSAPETLDTLGELATALEENQDVVDALNSAIGSKASQTDLDAIKDFLPLVSNNEFKAFATQYRTTSQSILSDDSVYQISFWECSKFNTLSVGDKILCFVLAYKTNEKKEIHTLFDCTVTSIGDTYYSVNATQCNISALVPSTTNRSVALLSELSNKADLTNESQNITANDITLQGYSMFDYCANLGATKLEQSESGTYYCKLSNGLIFQWGIATMDQTNATNKTITLPTSFSTTNYGVVGYHYGGTVTNDYLNSFKFMTRTTTSFAVRKHMGETGEQFIWIAIGF